MTYPYGGYGMGKPLSHYQQQMYQDRINAYDQQQYANQYNGYMRGQQAFNQPQQMINCRPVSSYDEAKASMIDLDGSLFVFTDVANKQIEKMFGSNPMFQRAKQMAQGKSENELKQIANNLCKQRGININDAYKQFQAQMQGMFGNR